MCISHYMYRRSDDDRPTATNGFNNGTLRYVRTSLLQIASIQVWMVIYGSTCLNLVNTIPDLTRVSFISGDLF